MPTLILSTLIVRDLTVPVVLLKWPGPRLDRFLTVGHHKIIRVEQATGSTLDLKYNVV